LGIVPVTFRLPVTVSAYPTVDAVDTTNPLEQVGAPVPALFFIVSTFNCDILLFLFSYLCSYEGYAMITIPGPPAPPFCAPPLPVGAGISGE